MTAISQSGIEMDVRRWLRIGGLTVVLLVVGIGGWSVNAALSGAVFAQAIVIVESNVKTVQHPTGGVVGELYVRDGVRVRAGELLVRLDETMARANLGVIDKALTELGARQARNEAERDDRNDIAFPAKLQASVDQDVGTVLRDEARLFAIRRAAREGQKAQLQERILQYHEEIRGFTQQVRAKDSEIALIGKELAGVRTLWEKQMVPIMRLHALERDAAKLGGERGLLLSSMAQTKGKISEIELQILQIDQNLRAEVGKDLAEVRAKTSELMERRVTAEDQLKRIDIRSPQDGVVHQLSVHTIGGVIQPGGQIMLIVPEGEELVVEAKIGSHEIDRIWVGQRATLRFTAFNQRTTPEIKGDVSRISADITNDPKTGAPYYTVRITLPEDELARLEGLKLVPGMPVESFIQTEERTVASYLLKPLTDHIAKAWKEK